MSFPLLLTKLHIPQSQSGLILRPRLLKRLDEGMEHKLTLVSAPAGFGKTSLIEQWAADCGLKVSWLSLDESDNDPTRFWGYLIAALQRIQPNLGETTRNLLVTLGQNLQSFPNEALSTTFLNEIIAFPDEIVLILDDYHLIETPAIHTDMIFLIDHLPANLHILLSSRMDPPFPLARLRARSQMIELRTDDLRFTVEETTSFLNQMMGLNLFPNDIVLLDNRTEGWIAGLKLAALSLGSRPDASAFIASFTGSHRFILDYLVEEVLHRQLDEVQTFLLETSILERFTAPLCDAVTGRKGSQGILDQLKRSNLFILSLDDERRWFRYHHLFADLLRSLLQQLSPERLPELHRRAAGWFEQNELIDEAVSHWLASSDFDRALLLIDWVSDRMLQKGEWRTLSGWADALPENLVRSSPSISLYHTWIRYLAGQMTPDETGERLAEVEAVLSGDREPEGSKNIRVNQVDLNWDQRRLLGKVSAARAGLAIFMLDAEQVITASTRALQLLPEEEIYWRNVADSCLAGAYEIHGDIQLARQALAEISMINQSTDNNYAVLVRSWRETRLQTFQGDLHRAAARCRKILHQADEQGMGTLLAASCIAADLGDILREWNELDDAYPYLVRGIRQLLQAQRPIYALRGYISLARLKCAQGDYAGAFEALAEIDNLVGLQSKPEWVNSRLSAWVARIQLNQGNLETAIRWTETSGLAESEDLRYAKEEEYLTLVRVLIAQARDDPGQPYAEQALYWLDRLLSFADAQERTGSVIEILALRSFALWEQGELSDALIALQRALSLAMPGGYVRLFVDEGEKMAQLISGCRSKVEKDIQKSSVEKQPLLDYIDRLLSAFNSPMLTPQSLMTQSPLKMNGLIEPLSSREIEVLRLVASGRSTEQIASELFISVGTVRNHLKSIYAKLDAHSRLQAVELARELSLL